MIVDILDLGEPQPEDRDRTFIPPGCVHAVGTTNGHITLTELSTHLSKAPPQDIPIPLKSARISHCDPQRAGYGGTLTGLRIEGPTLVPSGFKRNVQILWFKPGALPYPGICF